ncbi:GlxA family transcriptional regulator [Piscinibacter sp. XHJ-5]|uniref:GlxA family transcriptional regulator n=1 Tax=Piscinibacter sp. XHJ-5 TaxID=3037797 RepID=UPI0024533B70|nr:GlxA family transcriptional regulator [Piscinibacter sp. XHJ-5]
MKTVAVVLFPGFEILDLAITTVFELANGELGRPAYRQVRLSEDGGPVASSSGATVDSRRFRIDDIDTVLVMGSITAPSATPAMQRFLQRAQRSSSRIASICTGAFLLAQAGVLDGRRATTHWAVTQELQNRHPQIKVLPDHIFVKDGNVWSSAGMTACIDLGLALVEEDHGVDLARAIAKKMVVYHRRTSGQSQFSALLELDPKSDRIQKALTHVRANLRDRLSVEDLAEVAHLSARQFSRMFKAATGQAPAHAVEKLRVEAARNLIDAGELPLAVVAKETGFGDPDRMRRAFVRTLGQPPQTIRRVARQQAA